MGTTALSVKRTVSRITPAASYVVTPGFKFDALRLSLFLLIIMNVSRVHQLFGALSALRPGLLLIVLAFAAAVGTPPRALAQWGWANRWQAQVTFGILFVSLGSIAFGISQGAAFYFFANYFSKVLVFAFLLMAAIRNVRDLWMFVWAHVIGCALLVYMALFMFNLKRGTNGITRLDNLESWDANDLCVLLLIGLGLCLLAYHTSGRKGKFIAAGTMLGIGAAIARSGSRGGFVGLAAVLLAYLVSMKGTSILGRVALVVTLSLGLAVAAPSGYWTQMRTISTVQSDYNWDSDQGRRQLAARGMKYMVDYPLFGLGLSNFTRQDAVTSDFARHRMEIGKGVKWSAVHNSYVQAGSELGIPGFVFFVSLTIGCVVAPWRLRRAIPPDWENGDWEQRFLMNGARYMPLAAIGFAVPAFFVSFAYLEPLYTLAALTAALTALTFTKIKHGKGSLLAMGRAPGWRSAR